MSEKMTRKQVKALVRKAGQRQTCQGMDWTEEMFRLARECKRGKFEVKATIVEAYDETADGGVDWDTGKIENAASLALKLVDRFGTWEKCDRAIDRYNCSGRFKVELKPGQRTPRAIMHLNGAVAVLCPSGAPAEKTKAQIKAATAKYLAATGLSKAEMQAIVDAM